ncbi:MAG TPA: DUF2807 domain-containing protein, partial [Christiangramia sp.]|nr:DUF2807 domain-containing protein [Christiangramia sp.]
MKKLIYLLAIIGLVSCDSEDAGNCLQESGDIIQEEILVENFDEIIVYDKIKLYIEQGAEQKVVLETGENLLNEISVEVKEGRLVLKNDNRCNF